MTTSESVLRMSAKRGQVSQWPDGLDEFELRSRPPMGEKEGKGVGIARANVNELDVDAVDFRDEFPVAFSSFSAFRQS